jgi:imidazolonepropionase-like amidohydrolase
MSHLLLSSLLALTHVTIINVESGHLQRDTTILIKGERITAIGQIRIPPGAEVMDGAGTFVIPGLWDMHTHLPDDRLGRDAYLPLFVVNGVTGIRVMEGAPEHHRWREEIERGRLSGPRMIIGSRIIDGPKSFLPDAVIVHTPAEARKAVQQAKGEGADFVKVYDNLSPEAYDAIVSEAARQRLPVEGHLPASISAERASNAGQKSIEHLTGIQAAASDDQKARALFALFRKNHTWQCPTLIMRHNYGVLDDPHLADDPRLKYVRRSTAERWQRMTRESTSAPPTEWQMRRETFRAEEQLVGAMRRAGVGILAGTDNGNPYCFPGFSLHDELALLVEAGLTPLQALQSATVDSARFLGMRNLLGTVENGKEANLVVLDANPLEDIRNTKKIHAVVVRGHLLDRKALGRSLAQIEVVAATP